MTSRSNNFNNERVIAGLRKERSSDPIKVNILNESHSRKKTNRITQEQNKQKRENFDKMLSLFVPFHDEAQLSSQTLFFL
jgi:hypothetical protein